ncbi:phosphoenolpyruvate hydrolase family protein [Halosimplex rubrum]|uniref:Phosphoenolpyruvate hydrolase family protein n=1 Tax=Halosimplex rubrum TaxID=869889 RepID=A0A7D5P3S6_9EURY|nr:phosphoenolpyruvate hydrolase family protein [Halosimplex rubrum]QLH80017.1 phosphoenolpyruvate hydrolase family protein [Halosimplex rubrum]
MKFSRKEVMAKLQETVDAGDPIIGSGAGTGISAKFAERGGTDLIIIYNSGRYRMAGRGSHAGLLAYGDANEIVTEMAGEVIPVIEDTPVLAGVHGTDPFREMDVFLDEIERLGFSGVQNFPTHGLIDGKFGEELEDLGMGYDEEIKMIELASDQGLLTAPYVFDKEQARKMVRAGGDVIVAHLGLTRGGDIGNEEVSGLDTASERIQEIRNAAVDEADALDRDIFVISHGGALAEPEDIAYSMKKTTGVHGFFGASSVERLPTEVAIQKQVEEFKNID